MDFDITYAWHYLDLVTEDHKHVTPRPVEKRLAEILEGALRRIYELEKELDQANRMAMRKGVTTQSHVSAATNKDS
jgi:hypothetical protein